METRQETQQEKETRWAAQREARNSQDQTYRATRARARGRNWLIVGAIMLILVVIAAIKLL